jgi:hypothetical protein
MGARVRQGQAVASGSCSRTSLDQRRIRRPGRAASIARNKKQQWAGRAGPPQGSGKHRNVVDYRHVIYALRRKPMALLNLIMAVASRSLGSAEECPC